jgi:hypothetical protein
MHDLILLDPGALATTEQDVPRLFGRTKSRPALATGATSPPSAPVSTWVART